MSERDDRRAPRAAGQRWPADSGDGRRQLGTLALTMLRGFYRDRSTIFLTFLFPLMFLVVFGLIFGNRPPSRSSIGVVGDGAVARHAARGMRRQSSGTQRWRGRRKRRSAAATSRRS